MARGLDRKIHIRCEDDTPQGANEAGRFGIKPAPTAPPLHIRNGKAYSLIAQLAARMTCLVATWYGRGRRSDALDALSRLADAWDAWTYVATGAEVPLP